MIYNREIADSVRRLAKHFPALVLTGARQAGKTTLLREIFKSHSYVSLDLPSLANLAEEDPSEFLAKYPAPVIIDEVQYAPKLFRHLKTVIDEARDKNGQFILTGSQKFVLMKEVSDSLAGRCGVIDLENLSISELGPDAVEFVKSTSPGNILARGFFPQLWKDKEMLAADFYSSYLATYIERDVRKILNIGSVRDFERFMRACAARSGHLLNKSDISKDVGVTSETINQWISVLAASNQVTLLEPYFANISKRLIKSPKLYFNDTGLLCFLLGLDGNTVADSYAVGQIWETFVFAEMRKALADVPQATIWFYRDRDRELDFMISVGGKLHLFEAKWTEIPRPELLKPMKFIAETFPMPVGSYNIVCRTLIDFPLAENFTAINGLRLKPALKKLGLI
jgi:predicted AAA+ superfamily ATPase